MPSSKNAGDTITEVFFLKGKFPGIFVLAAVLFIILSAPSFAAGERILTIAQGSDMLTFDTQNHLNTSTDCVLNNMTNLLYRKDANAEVQPELAVSHERVSDTVWRFKIRNDVRFHNGDPLTAEDVQFTLMRAATDKSLREYPYFKVIKDVRAVDKFTVDIETFEPLPTLLRLVSKQGSNILPKNYIEKNGWDFFLKNPVYSGPFQFVSWVRDDRVVIKPFDGYWGGKNTEWDEIHFRVIPEVSTRVGELLTGGVDIIYDVAPNEWNRIKNNKGTALVNGETTRIMLLVVRCTEGTATADKRVREAIDYAIDNKALTDIVLSGSGTPTRTRVSRGVTGFDPSLYNTYCHDPEKSRKLLADAGYGEKNPLEITFTAPRGRYLMDSEIAQMIAGMLEEAGIKVKLELLEWTSFSSLYNAKKNRELLLIGLADNYFDANYPLIHYTKDRARNETDFSNDESDELYKNAAKNMNQEERVSQYHRIQQIAAEERPHICLYQLKANYGVNDRILFVPRIDELTYVNEIHRK